MNQLMLHYCLPSEIMKIQECWNTVISEGVKGAPDSHLDLTDGVSLSEQTSRDRFWDFILTQQPLGSERTKSHDSSLFQTQNTDSSTTTADEYIREQLLGYTGTEGSFDRDGLKAKMKEFFTSSEGMRS